MFLNDVGPYSGWIPGSATENKTAFIINLSLGLHYRF